MRYIEAFRDPAVAAPLRDRDHRIPQVEVVLELAVGVRAVGDGPLLSSVPALPHDVDLIALEIVQGQPLHFAPPHEALEL